MNTGFKEGVDTVVKKISSGEKMKNYAIGYLWLGFKEIGNEKLTQYIDETYRSVSTYSTDEKKNELEKKLAGYKAITQGQPAPRTYYSNAAGVEQEFLKNADADTLIIIFWVAWCPHCREALPLLDSAIGGHENIKVLAISLDTEGNEYMSLAEQLTHINHYRDFQK